MQHGPPRLRRARPVADAPIDALLLRTEDLTKGWLLALLEHAPLDDAPAILAADLVRDGPAICSAVVRALANDEDLHRLERGGALELLVSQAGEIAGSGGVVMTGRAVDALRGVIWSALRAELSHPDADQVADFSERLNLVSELVRAAALRRSAVADAPRTEPLVSRGSPGVRDAPEPVAVRDSLWKGALADEIRHAHHRGSALALLLVELEDAQRVRAVEPPGEATATLGRFAQAVRSVVRRQDILACESSSRAWIIARETGRLGAHALAARMVAAVGSAPPWRGAPLAITVGYAVLGQDGEDIEALLEAAEEARFTAAASGLGVIPIDDAPFRDPGPHPPGKGSGLAG